MEINLIKQFGTRNVDGIPFQDILEYGTSIENEVGVKVNYSQEGMGNDRYLGCVNQYFVPSKSYYKLTPNHDCSFTRKAMGYKEEPSCNKCFAFCINNCAVKKNTKIIKPPIS